MALLLLLLLMVSYETVPLVCCNVARVEEGVPFLRATTKLVWDVMWDDVAAAELEQLCTSATYYSNTLVPTVLLLHSLY